MNNLVKCLRQNTVSQWVKSQKNSFDECFEALWWTIFLCNDTESVYSDLQYSKMDKNH